MLMVRPDAQGNDGYRSRSGPGSSPCPYNGGRCALEQGGALLSESMNPSDATLQHMRPMLDLGLAVWTGNCWLVRIVGQAPLAATVYSLERLRCGACGQVFTAQEPEGVGPNMYDETAAAMIAQLKYGAGTPFNRLEQLEAQMGIPLPAATQWEIVEEAAQPLKPARDELIRHAAQGTVVHSDDTGMRMLMLQRDPKDERTGV